MHKYLSAASILLTFCSTIAHSNAGEEDCSSMPNGTIFYIHKEITEKDRLLGSEKNEAALRYNTKEKNSRTIEDIVEFKDGEIVTEDRVDNPASKSTVCRIGLDEPLRIKPVKATTSCKMVEAKKIFSKDAYGNMDPSGCLYKMDETCPIIVVRCTRGRNSPFGNVLDWKIENVKHNLSGNFKLYTPQTGDEKTQEISDASSKKVPNSIPYGNKTSSATVKQSK